jgi:hypothetical protein
LNPWVPIPSIKSAGLARPSWQKDCAAHALYEAMGFTEVDLLEPWIKEW